MKIEQLLMQEHGQKIGGMTLSIKTRKKTWQVGEIWWQQLICMDGTGEIPVDVKLGKYNPLNNKVEIKIIVAEVREAEYLGKFRKILVVDQFSVPTQTVDEMYAEADEAYQGEIKIVRSKIKCLLACHNGPKENLTKLKVYLMDKTLNECVDLIMEG